MMGHALCQGEIITNNKNTLNNFKIFFSWISEPISTKLGTMHPLVKGIQVCFFVSSLNHHYDIISVFIDLKFFLRWAMWPMGFLLAHLSRRLKWALSIVRRHRCCRCCRQLFTFSSSSPEPLGFNETWHKASLGGEGDSNLFRWRAPSFSKWRLLRNIKNTLLKLKKNLLLQNHLVNFNQTWHNTSLGKGDSS